MLATVTAHHHCQPAAHRRRSSAARRHYPVPFTARYRHHAPTIPSQPVFTCLQPTVTISLLMPSHYRPSPLVGSPRHHPPVTTSRPVTTRMTLPLTVSTWTVTASCIQGWSNVLQTARRLASSLPLEPLGAFIGQDMCKYLRFCRRYFADVDLCTKFCGQGFVDEDSQTKIRGRRFATTNIWRNDLRIKIWGYENLRNREPS